MKRFALALALSLCALPASAQTVRPAPSWLHYYLPIHPQVALVPGVGGGTTFTGGAITGVTSFLDGANFSIKNTADATKVLQFDVSGVTTANTITPFAFRGTAAAPSVGIPSGTVTEPSLQFTADADTSGTGMYRPSADAIGFANSGVKTLHIQNGLILFGTTTTTDVWMGSAGTFGWSNNTNPGSGSLDTTLSREGAAVFQAGADVNGTGVAQTFKGPDGITGSNVIGGNFTVSSGIGTGNGAGAQTSLGRAIMTASGTSAQTRTQAVTACESKTLSNTTATATAIANVALASNSSGAVRITVSVQCTDGTNFDSDLVTSYVGYVNKAAAVTVGTPVTTASAAANNSGSCTVAPTFVANGNSIDIKVTPAFTTIVPTTTTAFVNVENLGPGAVTCN